MTGETARNADATELLIELARALHAESLPADQTEELLTAAAERLEEALEPLVLQSALFVQIGPNEQARVRLRRMEVETHMRLARMQEVIDLARAIANGTFDVASARRELRRITTRRSVYPHWAVCAGYAGYGAAAAARAGGGPLEMVVGALTALVAFAIHFGAARSMQVDLQQSLIAGAAGLLCVFACALLLPPFGMSQALYGGVVLLVPATTLTIGVQELSSGELESGVMRAAYAMLRFLMLGAGIVAALHAWVLFTPVPVFDEPHPLPAAAVFAILGVGSIPLAVCLQARMRDLGLVVLGVLVAWGVEELSKHVVGNPSGTPMLAAFVLAAVAQLQARFTGRAPALVIVPGLLQLTPGFLGTETVLHVFQPAQTPAGSGTGVPLVALQVVSGLVTGNVLFQRARRERPVLVTQERRAAR